MKKPGKREERAKRHDRGEFSLVVVGFDGWPWWRDRVDTGDQLAIKDPVDRDSGIDYGVLECVVSVGSPGKLECTESFGIVKGNLNRGGGGRRDWWGRQPLVVGCAVGGGHWVEQWFAVGGDDDRWWSEETTKGVGRPQTATTSRRQWRRWRRDGGGGGGRNSGELAKVEAAKAGPVGRCGARQRCEAAVDATAVRAVEGDDDGDGFGGGGETGVRRMKGGGAAAVEDGHSATGQWRSIKAANVMRVDIPTMARQGPAMEGLVMLGEGRACPTQQGTILPNPRKAWFSVKIRKNGKARRSW
ncbi:hypothetical protein Scep_024477 [Stephania cephalantha]|uniref:Uncharacterized protein n=1 Tax=Stephania cephalantha TaxID=152367 RepID=A0AAP0EZH9_9MAGN